MMKKEKSEKSICRLIDLIELFEPYDDTGDEVWSFYLKPRSAFRISQNLRISSLITNKTAVS